MSPEEFTALHLSSSLPFHSLPLPHCRPLPSSILLFLPPLFLPQTSCPPPSHSILIPSHINLLLPAPPHPPYSPSLISQAAHNVFGVPFLLKITDVSFSIKRKVGYQISGH